MGRAGKPRKCPVGTIRDWQDGTFIKAHEGSVFSSGWIPYDTSTKGSFDEIGRDCDRMASTCMSRREPIDGELFLDHEINTYEGGTQFRADEFKKYEGWYGASRYSFRNAFGKRLMEPKIAIAEEIHKRLLEANGDNRAIRISDDEIKDIRARVRSGFKYTGEIFSVQDAKELQGIIKRTYDQLIAGFNFTGDQKEIYEDAIKKADKLADKYERMAVKTELRDSLIEKINTAFPDNWGVRESFKKRIDKEFDDYVKKYAKQIEEDEARDQENIFGVKVLDDPQTFYAGLYKKLKPEFDKQKKPDLNLAVGKEFKIKTYGAYNNETFVLLKDEKGDFYLADKELKENVEKEQEELSRVYDKDELDDEERAMWDNVKSQLSPISIKYPYRELIYLRFQLKYGKTLDGNWRPEMLPAIENFEKMALALPQGHVLTNDYLKAVTNVDYKGGDSGGYAWYSPNEKRINISDACVKKASVFGKLDDYGEFNATLSHEIGHAVSNKLGREQEYLYKKFVVECGWSYQQQLLKEGKGDEVTGDDLRIAREGRNSHRTLLTDYAHVSPEEAFAEFYSFYHLNKDLLDTWFKTDNDKIIKKDSKTIYDKNKDLPSREVNERSHLYKLDDHVVALIADGDKLLKKYKLEADKDASVQLLSPWELNVSKGQSHKIDKNEIKYRLHNAGFDDLKLATVINDNGHNVLIEGINEAEIAKYIQQPIPSITISKELYWKLHDNGWSKSKIVDYVHAKLFDHKIPKPAHEKKEVHGIIYRNEIIPWSTIKACKEPLKQMATIYSSDILKKALSELFSQEEIIEKSDDALIKRSIKEQEKYKDLSFEEAKYLYGKFKDLSKLKKTEDDEYYIEVNMTEKDGDKLVNTSDFKILSSVEKKGYGYIIGDSFTALDKTFEFTHSIRMYEDGLEDEFDKAFETIQIAFDNDQITEDQFLLAKAKHVEKRVHTSKKTGKKWLETHHVGKEEKKKKGISKLLNDYLSKLIGMGFNEKQKEFWQWQVEQAHEIEVSSLDEIFKENPKIKKFIDANKSRFKAKQCYANSALIALEFPEIKYVEGFAFFHGIPMEHAWNKIGDKYFDVTNDYILKEKFGDKSKFDEYNAIIEIDQERLQDNLLESGWYGNHIKDEFVAHKKINKAIDTFYILDAQQKAATAVLEEIL